MEDGCAPSCHKAVFQDVRAFQVLSDYLEEIRFFQPTVPLTQRLVKAVDTARSADLRRIREDKEQIEDDEDALLEGFQQLDTVQEYFSPPFQTSQQQTALQQHSIAEKLYYHLAFLAGNPKAKVGEALSIREAIVGGMSNSLGLSPHDELLAELNVEFDNWLSERGEFTMGWGKIILADNHRMYLEEFEVDEVVTDKPTKRVFIPRSKTQRTTSLRPEIVGQTPTLRLGDIAPDFTANTTEGPIQFHEWIADSWAVFFSYPEDFNPVSATELAEASRLKPEFEKRNAKMIGLSVEPEFHDRWAEDIREMMGTTLNFPLIADPDQKIAELYDMIHPDIGNVFTVRSVFVIGPDKKIKLMITYPASTGRNFDEILRVIDSLQLTAKYSVATPVNWKDGDDVIIVPSMSDEDAKARFPCGWKAPKPYLRITPQPGAGKEKSKAHS
jgi:alkyl hydroperoxide reductase subunit AhpC